MSVSLTFIAYAMLLSNISTSFSTPFSRLSRRGSRPQSRSLNHRRRQLRLQLLRESSANQRHLRRGQHQVEMQMEDPSARPRTSFPVRRHLKLQRPLLRLATGLRRHLECSELCLNPPPLQVLSPYPPDLSQGLALVLPLSRHLRNLHRRSLHLQRLLL